MSSKYYKPRKGIFGRLATASPLVNLALFLITGLSVVMAGAVWSGKIESLSSVWNPQNWKYGLEYGVLIMVFLSAHEFGHYIASRIHKVDASLPFYIPILPIPGLGNLFGTMGAVIVTRSQIMSRKALFDIGAAGPLAGFVVCVIYLIYGFSTLPPIDFIFEIHPAYKLILAAGGDIPRQGLHFGDNLAFFLFEKIFANPDGWSPPMNEIYHYPFLNVGWFGLFVTALNLLPLGSLDGGHIAHAMFGRAQKKIGIIFWRVMAFIGAGGFIRTIFFGAETKYPDLHFPANDLFFIRILESTTEFYLSGWPGWLFWAVVVRILVRRIEHPPVPFNEPIGSVRQALGWVAIAVLILSFSYNGFYIIGNRY